MQHVSKTQRVIQNTDSIHSYKSRTTGLHTVCAVLNGSLQHQISFIGRHGFLVLAYSGKGLSHASNLHRAFQVKAQRCCEPIHTTNDLSLKEIIEKLCSVQPRIIIHKIKSDLASARKKSRMMIKDFIPILLCDHSTFYKLSSTRPNSN